MTESESETIECPICCDDVVKLIKCCFCPNEACKDCISRYLLDSNDDPGCMNRECKQSWNLDFILTHFDKKFEKRYIAHRREVLLNREKAYLPATQQEYYEKNKRDKELEPLLEKKERLKAKMKRIAAKIDKINTEIYTIRRGGAISEKKERKSFIRKCPVDDCRGFLSTAWKCGLCDAKICKECSEVKEADHECDPDTVETMKEINSSSKPCPGCGILTYKISGCPQMWCVDCKCVWDWNSGQKVNDRIIHNPHYYQWRQNNQGAIREPGDAVCGGIPEFTHIDNVIRRYEDNEAKRGLIISIHRFTVELRQYRLQVLNPTPVTPELYKDLRMRYLAGEIDEKLWKQNLTTREKTRELNTETYLLYSMFCDVSEEIFRKIQIVKKKSDYVTCYDELYNLLRYTHDQGIAMAKKWNRAVSILRINIHDMHLYRAENDVRMDFDQQRITNTKVTLKKCGDIITCERGYRGERPCLTCNGQNKDLVEKYRDEIKCYDP